MSNETSHHPHSPSYYVKIWALLLVLLVVSVIGPWFEIKVVTLITAFGVAVVKALIVAAYFMHLNIEKKMITYLFVVFLGLLILLWAGTVADVMHLSGQNWIKI